MTKFGLGRGQLRILLWATNNQPLKLDWKIGENQVYATNQRKTVNWQRFITEKWKKREYNLKKEV